MSITSAGWPSAARQVDEPSLGDDEDALAPDLELLDHGPHVATLSFGQPGQGDEVDLDVEVTRVGHDGTVVHPLEVLGPQDVSVARSR